MLRDMEEMLNKVQNQETKVYIYEALKCYNAGSFKACVIMSVISGIYDLHMKVKELAPSDLAFRELDNKIEQKKRDLEVYEKYLIEQCATEEIDMLNSNEAKELIRCLDTRNDCAHPSNFVCSPEKARDIFTSIIDILASKPVLFGCRHMNNLIIELEEKSFFPVKEPSRMKLIVEEKLTKFHPKALSPLLKLVCKNIINPKSSVHKKNLICFLAYSLKKTENEYESIITPLVEKDQYETELLELLYENIQIIDQLNDTSIEKLIFKLGINLDTAEVVNTEYWIKVILSTRLQREDFKVQISSMLTAFKTSRKINAVRYEFIYRIVNNDDCNTGFYEMLKKGMNKEFILDHYEDSELRNLMEIFKYDILFTNWINIVSGSVCNWDFNIGNKAVYLLKAIDKEVWIDLVSKDSKDRLVSSIMTGGLRERYHSHSCENLMWELSVSYPELSRGFVERLFESNGSFINENKVIANLNKKYRDVVISYIKNEEDLVNDIIEKLEKWNYCGDGVDLDYIIGKLKG